MGSRLQCLQKIIKGHAILEPLDAHHDHQVFVVGIAVRLQSGNNEGNEELTTLLIPKLKVFEAVHAGGQRASAILVLVEDASAGIVEPNLKLPFAQTFLVNKPVDGQFGDGHLEFGFGVLAK